MTEEGPIPSLEDMIGQGPEHYRLTMPFSGRPYWCPPRSFELKPVPIISRYTRDQIFDAAVSAGKDANLAQYLSQRHDEDAVGMLTRGIPAGWLFKLDVRTSVMFWVHPHNTHCRIYVHGEFTLDDWHDAFVRQRKGSFTMEAHELLHGKSSYETTSLESVES